MKKYNGMKIRRRHKSVESMISLSELKRIKKEIENFCFKAKLSEHQSLSEARAHADLRNYQLYPMGRW